MPLLSIVTNVSVTENERAEILAAASGTVSELLGKPETYVMVHLTDNAALTFGGSSEPACFMQLKSLSLPEEETKRFSGRLCDFADAHLGIGSERTYIEFINPPRHMWGYDRRTFQR